MTSSRIPKLLITLVIVFLMISGTILSQTTNTHALASQANDRAKQQTEPVFGLAENSAVPNRVNDGTFTIQAGDCLGCEAKTRMEWTDYGAWERVRFEYAKNIADEIIDEQHVHGALIADDDGQCPGFEGVQKWTEWSPKVQDQSGLEIGPSSNYTGYNDAWQLASGHDWWDDGGHWEVKGGADICHEF